MDADRCFDFIPSIPPILHMTTIVDGTFESEVGNQERFDEDDIGPVMMADRWNGMKGLQRPHTGVGDCAAEPPQVFDVTLSRRWRRRRPMQKAK